jgi:hypothetical protein
MGGAAVGGFGGWFVACWLGLVIPSVAVAITCWLRSRRSAPAPAPARLPDFEVYDRGGDVHFVPADTRDHVLDPNGQCHCRPSRTINHRRCGNPVLYVDHRLVGVRQSASR